MGPATTDEVGVLPSLGNALDPRSPPGTRPFATASTAAGPTTEMLVLPGRLIQATATLLAAAISYLAPGPSAPPDSSVVLAVLAWARRQYAVTTHDINLTALQAVVSPVQGGLTPSSASTAAVASVSAVDSTDTLQAKFDALNPGDTVTLAPGTYQHSGNLYIRVPGVTINGNGATLQATNPATSALGILADNVTLSNLNISQPIGLPREDNAYRAGLVVGDNTGVTVRNVVVTGGSSVGIVVIGASNFLLDGVIVRDTASDGIQMYAGANNGQVNNARTQRTGDDGIAVVSYMGDPICHDIVINAPVVNGALKTRGLVVTGGDRITFNNITVVNTALSGVFIGAQSGTLPTQSATNITVTGGAIAGANFAMGIPLGAISIWSENPDAVVSDVTISKVTILNTPPQAYRNILQYNNGGGAISNVIYRNIAIQEQPELPVFYTNAPGTYSASYVFMNGRRVF